MLDFKLSGAPPIELIKGKAKVVRLVHLYSFKFGEFFATYYKGFFDKIWGMIQNNEITASKKNEKLVGEVVRYLSEMANHSEMNDFFKTNMISLF